MDVWCETGEGLQFFCEGGHFDVSCGSSCGCEEVLEGCGSWDEGVEVFGGVGCEVDVGPVFEAVAHVGAVASEEDVVHGGLDFDVLLTDGEVEAGALEEEVDVGVPVGFWVVVAEEFHVVVGAYGSCLEVVALVGAFVVVVGVDHVDHAGGGGGGELCGDVVGGEGEFGCVAIFDGVDGLVLAIDGDAGGDDVVEDTHFEVSVEVVDEYEVGVGVDFLEDVLVGEKIFVAAGEFDVFHEVGQGEEEEAFAGSSVALAGVSDFVVHGEGGPGAGGGFVAVEEEADDEDFVEEGLLLLVDLVGGEPFAVDAEGVGAVVGFGGLAVALESGLELFAPVEA